jgi:phasin family protein
LFSLQNFFSPATKANFETNTELTRKSLESVEKFFDLEMQIVKLALDEANTAVKSIMAAEQPQELVSLIFFQTLEHVKEAFSYAFRSANITVGLHAELTKIVDDRLADFNTNLITLINDLRINLPADVKNGFTLVESAINSSNTNYKQITEIAKQLAHVFEELDADTELEITQLAHKSTQRHHGVAVG